MSFYVACSCDFKSLILSIKLSVLFFAIVFLKENPTSFDRTYIWLLMTKGTVFLKATDGLRFKSGMSMYF